MTEDPETPTLLTDLERLIALGVLGFYTHVEATEIFAVPEGQKSTVNVFTILVAEKREAASTGKSRHLNAKRIRIKSLKGWYFGIERYVRPISDLIATLRLFEREHILSLSEEGLGFGKIEGIVHQFVPADPRVPVPLNRVLKNNFWNGSHVFEWIDPEKQALQPLGPQFSFFVGLPFRTPQTIRFPGRAGISLGIKPHFAVGNSPLSEATF